LARFRAVGRHFALAWPALAEPWSYLPIVIDDIWTAGVPSDVNNAAFYTTEALRETLSELVDFTIINRLARQI